MTEQSGSGSTASGSSGPRPVKKILFDYPFTSRRSTRP